MNTAVIKQQLHNYLEVANDKKLKAIYTMVEDEIIESTTEYSDEYKAELDRRVNYYLKGGKMVTADEMNRRLKAVRSKRK